MIFHKEYFSMFYTWANLWWLIYRLGNQISSQEVNSEAWIVELTDNSNSDHQSS